MGCGKAHNSYTMLKDDKAAVISILNQILECPCNEREKHEIKYLIEVLSHDWMFEREMNTYEEEEK